ncbi:MAG: aminotransferase class V-fold PLP-dependent enzyme [Acidobacteriota bacterium]
MINRRLFIKSAAALAAMGAGLRPSRLAAGRTPSVYAELGLRPFINAAGTYTTLSASLMPEEVVEAMEEAASAHVSIPELQQAVSRKIASWLYCEAALVTSGCAAALTLATAACVAGKDQAKIQRVPDTTGMKNEVIFQKSHRFGYDHAIRNVGVKIIEIETREGLEAAVNERTAMFFFFNANDSKGQIRREEFAQIANRRGIPCLIDAAADLPPAGGLRDYTKMGYDLVAFSGGKGLRGPQCSGLLIGRKELIEAAYVNGSPHSDTVGRLAKVGKEEIVGLYRALQLYLEKDHKSEWAEWERRIAVIERDLSRVPGIKTNRFVPEIANASPHLHLDWDPKAIAKEPRQIVENLRSGDPRIELRPGSEESKKGLDVSVWMLRSGEEKIVAKRLREVFAK